MEKSTLYGVLSKQTIITVLSILLVVIFGCNKSAPEIPINNYVLFPMGKKTIEANDLKIKADSIINEYSIIEDLSGGRWIKIAFSKLNLNSIVNIEFAIRSDSLVLIDQPIPVPEIWLKPSTYIDSEHPLIIEKANHLTDGINGIYNKARNIQLYVWDDIDFKVYMDSGIVPASTTLDIHYGTCINFARLFVALCRAEGIPARTIWGSLNTGAGYYNGHHNWAEYLGDDNKWHAVGLSFSNQTDMNDLRYLDLMYAPEENPHFEEYKMYRVSSEGDYYFYDGSGSAVDGKLGVQTISNNFPDEMLLLMSYRISDLFKD